MVSSLFGAHCVNVISNLVSKSGLPISLAYHRVNHPPSASVLLNRLKVKARFRHLQVLVSLGELSSIRRTADALGLSQPAVTQSLADLERLIEQRLFDRHSRGMRMSPAGRELLPLARRMLDTLAEASDALAAARQNAQGVVRVAAITGAIAGMLVQVLPKFALAHPEISVHVRESDPEQWGLQLARAEVDMALVREPAVTPAGTVFKPLLEDRFVVVCSPTHKMSGRRGVTWQRLAQCTWLPQAVGSAARETFDRMMGEVGTSPKMVPLLTRASPLTVALVESLDVLALLPLSVVRPWVDSGQLRVVDVLPGPAFRPLGVVWPEGQVSEATTALVNFVEAWFARPDDHRAA